MRYLISAVMATYNGKKYLKDQIESILNQTYPIYEIIIVDDCSKDGTWDILLDYSKKYEHIKIFRNANNIGCVQTFSKALELVAGDFIALSDQDDIWLPYKIETLLQNIKSDYDFAHSDAYLCNESLVTYGLYSDAKGLHHKKNGFVNYLNYNDVSGCTALFSRELLKKILPIPDGFWMHDHYLAIMASYYGNVIYVNKPLIKYRQHLSNVLGAKSNLSYQKRKTWEFNVANSLLLLKKRQEFSQNSDVDNAIQYHMSKYLGKIPNLIILKWCFQNYGMLQSLKLLTASLGNNEILNKVFYSIRGIVLGK